MEEPPLRCVIAVAVAATLIERAYLEIHHAASNTRVIVDVM